MPDPSSIAEARDSRRWLIGVGISVAFGLFGVLMALLSYFGRSKPSPAPTVDAPTNGVSEAPSPRHDRKHEDRHR